MTMGSASAVQPRVACIDKAAFLCEAVEEAWDDLAGVAPETDAATWAAMLLVAVFVL